MHLSRRHPLLHHLHPSVRDRWRPRCGAALSRTSAERPMHGLLLKHSLRTMSSILFPLRLIGLLSDSISGSIIWHFTDFVNHVRHLQISPNP
jgi:hypothetical protein